MKIEFFCGCAGRIKETLGEEETVFFFAFSYPKRTEEMMINYAGGREIKKSEGETKRNQITNNLHNYAIRMSQ
jgi:hypothetical protein